MKYTTLRGEETAISFDLACVMRMTDGCTTLAEVMGEAHEAGLMASANATPIPMIVEQHVNPLDDSSKVVQRWTVPAGACGFAWVNIRGLRGKMREAVKWFGFRANDYERAMQRWVHEFNQSAALKAAYAGAFAEVLRKHGFKASSGDRLD